MCVYVPMYYRGIRSIIYFCTIQPNGIRVYKYKNRKLIMRNRKTALKIRLKGRRRKEKIWTKKKSYFYGRLNLMYCNMFIYVTQCIDDVVESKCILNETKLKVRHWLKGFSIIYLSGPNMSNRLGHLEWKIYKRIKRFWYVRTGRRVLRVS